MQVSTFGELLHASILYIPYTGMPFGQCAIFGGTISLVENSSRQNEENYYDSPVTCDSFKIPLRCE